MILDEKKMQCIDYIIEGYTITQVSKLCNCSRQAIYDWLKDGDFKNELNKRTQEMSVAGNKKIVADVDKYINKLKLLALEGKSEKIQKKHLLIYLTEYMELQHQRWLMLQKTRIRIKLVISTV
ncbi:MAG: helix-turn-helix domain-containing protein [Clostridium argentinense]|nr:helix-turn-helix domain-containing protein [Clostridium argentinense]